MGWRGAGRSDFVLSPFSFSVRVLLVCLKGVGGFMVVLDHFQKILPLLQPWLGLQEREAPQGVCRAWLSSCSSLEYAVRFPTGLSSNSVSETQFYQFTCGREEICYPKAQNTDSPGLFINSCRAGKVESSH